MQRCVLLCVVALAFTAVSVSAFDRTCLSLDFDWRFQLGAVNDSDAVIEPSYDDSTWRQLNVPHDFVVEGTFSPKADEGHGYLPTNVGWYRREFTLTDEQQTDAVWWIEFDGVYRNSTVWLNGQMLGQHASGYISFRYNLTQAVLAPAGQPNVLVVYVDATYFEGWWYEGGGIYRHVHLCGAEPLYVPPQGVSVTGHVTGAILNNGTLTSAATVQVNTTVWNVDSVAHTFALESNVIDASGKTVATVSTQLSLKAGQALATTQSLTMDSAWLWGIDQPYLYSLQSKLVPTTAIAHRRHSRNTKQAQAQAQAQLAGDVLTTTFGIRTLRFDTDAGFFLNDQFVKVKGMCNHQDFGGVGVAMPLSVHEFRLRMLKDMGVNAVRASHNAQAPEFLDLCDKLGLLVWNEERLYNGVDRNTLPELTSLVTRDRNHPSVFMWSLCNEYSCGSAQTFTPLRDLVKALDGDWVARPVTAAMNHGWYDTDSMSSILDVVGFNYNIGEWTNYHSKHPQQPLTGSETSSAITTRGIYADNATAGYLSAYDVHAPGWGNTAWQAWQPEAADAFMEGGFVWTGFDYKGEPTPYAWPCINSHFGVIDIVGFPKDNFFYYQAWWLSSRPMVHILPHWTWPASQTGKSIDVWVYTAASYVELLLNGKSLGVKAMPRNFHVNWGVPYAAGTLQAIAYDEKNATWAVETLQTAGEAVAIELSVAEFSPEELNGDGQDTALITVKIVDATGNLVPVADDLVTFEVTGAGTLLGVGNGDPSCHDPDKATFRRAFGGLARALLQANVLEPGSQDDVITLTATASGLKSASIQIPVHVPDSLLLA